MGLTEKRVVLEDRLNDDHWHTVRVTRRGMVITAAVDEEKPVVGEEETDLDFIIAVDDIFYFASYT